MYPGNQIGRAASVYCQEHLTLTTGVTLVKSLSLESGFPSMIQGVISLFHRTVVLIKWEGV